MSDNRTTELFRKLLDKRGVKWRESVNVANCVFTIYESPIFGEIAAMDDGEYLYFHELNGISVTPEQAIATTLGSGTLTAEQVREAIENHGTASLGCRWQFTDRNLQAIADELNATLGGGECIPHGEWESISQTQEVRRMFCECGYELGMDEHDSFPFERTQLFEMPNYCQECGRKIRKAVEQ